ncbi:hypothetical protein BU15DRAFT_60678 [Melanogaster broomeanus]|nr:hypothetical protein BU15DRAFT_60678 [Melanogaster broomeanus]
MGHATTVCEFDSNAALVIVPDLGSVALARVLAGILLVVAVATVLFETAWSTGFVVLAVAMVADRATDVPRGGAPAPARAGVERAVEGTRVVACETDARTIDYDVAAPGLRSCSSHCSGRRTRALRRNRPPSSR